jgi:DeoR family myo-inositol catabolism operon transcriptional repressor
MRADRLNLMEEYIIQNGTVSLESLAEHFQVSINTVRRDLKTLLQRERVTKVYGGVSSNTQAIPLSMSDRDRRNREEKKQIGALAASLVEDNSSIFLDSGSTTPMILPHLAHKTGVTVVTHSLRALYEASKYPNLKIIALGGSYNPVTCSYVGISTMEALSSIGVQTAFVAATGVSLAAGLTNTTYLEAEIKRHVVQHAQRVVLMADHSKFDFSSVISFYNFDELYAVVTDQQPSRPYLEVIQKKGIQLLCP